MRLKHLALILPLALATTLSAAPPTSPPQRPLKIAGLEARLFYDQTGKFSDDLLKRNPPFSGWNTIISGDQSADDLLVTVRLQPATGTDEVFTTSPVTITATAGGKVVGKRTYSGTLVPAGGSAYKALLLHGIGCAGTLKIDVVTGKSRRSAPLTFECGE